MSGFAFSNAILAFRRTICAILVSILSLGISSGLSVDIMGARYDKDSVVTYCFYDSTRKIQQNEFIDKTATYDIRLARNEYEACQLVLRSRYNSPSRKYTVEFSSFKNEKGDGLESIICEEKYIRCESDKDYGKYPDALVPVEGIQTLTMNCAKNWPFYIKVHADKDTPAGTYTATVTVKNCSENDRVELIAKMTATVWDFTLPDTPSCETAFGLGKEEICKAHCIDVNSENATEMYKVYYEYLLDHKISPYNLPYDVLDSRADAYMSDPRCTSFCLPYWVSDDTIRAYYSKLSTDPEWLAKAYFYLIDEPKSLAEYEKYNEMTDRLASLFPGYNMVTPAFLSSFEENGKTYYTAELQKGRSNIVCGISNIFDSKEFLSAVQQRRNDGCKIWWYVCCGPQDKYCNVFTDREGIRGRLLLWQQKSLDVEGLLYWDTTFWGDVISPWCDALTTPWTGNTAFGDGALLFNGNAVGINGPVASMRLEEISDGIDDFEYLTMAEKLFGRGYVDEKIACVSASLTDYTLDDKRLTSVRTVIGNDIEAKLAAG